MGELNHTRSRHIFAVSLCSGWMAAAAGLAASGHSATLLRLAGGISTESDPEDAKTAGTESTDALAREGRRLFTLARFEEARETWDRVLAERRADPADTDALARALEDAAEVRIELERHDEAAARLDEALHVREGAREGDDAGVAHALRLKAFLAQRMGHYDRERPLVERALVLLDQHDPTGAETVWTRCLMGELLWLEGRLVEAHASFERAVADAEAVGVTTTVPYVRCLGRLATTEVYVGDATQGLRLHESALSLARQWLGPDHPETGGQCNDLADAKVLTGDWEGALPLYQLALSVARRSEQTARNAVAERLYNLALLQAQRGDFDEARRLHAQALALWIDVHGPEHPYVARAWHGWGDALLQEGRIDEARAALTQALRIHERAEGPDHPQVGLTLASLAAVYERTGEARAADVAAEDALRILASYGLAGEIERARLMALRARLALAARDTPRALNAALDAERLRTDHLRRTVRYLPEWQALDAVERSNVARDLALAVVAARPDDARTVARAWDMLVRSRTLVLDEIASRRTAAGSDPEVAKLQDRERRAGLRLATLVHRGPGVDAAMIDVAQRELDESEAQLGLASVSFRVAHERVHAGLREVQAALPEASALLAFARYESPRRAQPAQGSLSESAAGGYLAFVLERQGAAPEVVALGDAARLDRLLAFWQACATDFSAAQVVPHRAESNCRDVGLAVTRAFWEPLAPHLRRAKRVFIVPDGPLRALNLAALPLEAGGYLVESGPTLHYLTSERDLLPGPPARARHTDMVALGGAAFDTTPTRVAAAAMPAPWPPDRVQLARVEPPVASALVFRGGPPSCASDVRRDWRYLAGTRAEAVTLLDLWARHPEAGRGWLLEGEGAGETALKRLAGRARVLHLATHGFALADDCGGTSASRAARRHDNPLLRAGVVLAGANHRADAGPGQDDGILTAEEAASLDLDGTEWVVLSGCETGRGAWHASDGVLGLRRAFAVAGARTVIMSLWAVDDAYARRWMRALYEARFEQHLDTAEAVRAASLAILRARRQQGASTHPALWAAFVATGDWH